MKRALLVMTGVSIGLLLTINVLILVTGAGATVDERPVSTLLQDISDERVHKLAVTAAADDRPVSVHVELRHLRPDPGPTQPGVRDPDLMSPGAGRLIEAATYDYKVTVPAGVLDSIITDVTAAGGIVEVTGPRSPSKLWSLLPVLVIVGLVGGFVWLSRHTSGTSATARAKEFTSTAGPVTGVPDVRFEDIGGIDEVVAEAKEIVEFLSDPGRFRRVGAKIPSGFLLAGPPGTGKTMLAKAIAGEAGVPFFSVSGSEFTEMYVGVGASRVRDLFRQARAAGRAVVFIDEIDAVGRARAGGRVAAGSEEREQTLNQLLVEMGGFAGSGQVFVLAATNRADILDQALLRPGRFDRRIELPLPDRAGRERILRLHAKSRKLDPKVDLGRWAARCPGFSGAQLGALVNQAALAAGRRNATAITDDDFEEAFSSEVLGPARRSVQRMERDRAVVAHHEAGHALVALALEDADPPEMISVVPRGPAGGATFFADSDLIGRTRSELTARLAVMMGGRAAEERLFDGEFTQGASGDYMQATRLATQMVAEWGMSPAGPGVFDPSSTKVREHAQTLLDEALATARKVLEDHDGTLQALAARLGEVETMDRDRIIEFAAEHLGLDASRWPQRR